MAQATKRSASSGASSGSSRKRAGSNGSSASARSRNSRARASSSKQQTKTRSRNSGGTRAKAKRSGNGGAPSRAKANAAATAEKATQKNGGGMVKNVVLPVATAVAGAAAGVVLGRQNRGPKKVLGIPVPGTRNGLGGVAKEVRKAGQQFGNLASEVKTAREKAEDIGKAIS